MSLPANRYMRRLIRWPNSECEVVFCQVVIKSNNHFARFIGQEHVQRWSAVAVPKLTRSQACAHWPYLCFQSSQTKWNKKFEQKKKSQLTLYTSCQSQEYPSCFSAPRKNMQLCWNTICVETPLRRCKASSDGRESGGKRGSVYHFWPLSSSLWHVLLVGSLKASGLPSRAHPSPISLIKVRLTLPVWSQAGRAAFMFGNAHYSDILASATATEGSTKCWTAPAKGCGIFWISKQGTRNDGTNCAPLTRPVILAF